MSGGIQFHDVSRHLIHDPQIVLRIDPDLLRVHEAVTVLPDFTTELAIAVETEQPRTAVRESARTTERHGGVAGSRVDENVTFRIRGDSGDFA